MNIYRIGKKITNDTFRIRVTPELAEQLLKLNYKNQRTVRQQIVNTYAADMLAGNWRETASDQMRAEWDKQGNILYFFNGQHRLLAVVKSGQTVSFEVRWANEKDYEYMDQGSKRTTGDYIEGKYAKLVAAVIPMIIRRQRSNNFINISTLGKTGATTYVTRSDVLDFIKKYPEQVEIIRKYCGDASSVRIQLKSAPSREVGFLFWAMNIMWKPDDFEDFITDFKRNDPESKAIRIFIKWWREQASSRFKPNVETLTDGIIWTYKNFKKTRRETYPVKQTVGLTGDLMQELYEKRKNIL